MWNLVQLAVATLPIEPPLHVDAVGGKPIALQWGSTTVRLDAVETADSKDKAVLPTCDEHFVRGNNWHLNYPQADRDYAIRLMLGVVPNQFDATIIECEVSVQTDLLDLHPQIDLTVESGLVPVSGSQGDGSTARIFRINGGDTNAAILLGPHDYPHTSTIPNETSGATTSGATTLRLFGEFLEKGVIRRAHPWIVIGDSLTDDSLLSIWDQLASSPLPLD